MSTSDRAPTDHRRPPSGIRRRGGVVVSAAVTALAASCSSAPVDVTPTAPAAAVASQCRALLAALPKTAAEQGRRDVEPSGALAAAWGDPAIVLRCGVPDPPTFKPTSQCWVVDQVPWFATDDAGRPLPDTGPIHGDIVFTTIGRSANVEVVVPDRWTPQSDALFDVAGAIKSATTRLHGCS